MTETEKFALLSRILQKAKVIAETHSVDPESVYPEIIRLIASLANTTFEATAKNRANYITKDMLTELNIANVTLADCENFKNLQYQNKNLCRESLIKIMENALADGETLSLEQAEAELHKIIEGHNSTYLSDTENASLKKAALTKIAVEEVLDLHTQINIPMLLTVTTLSPRQAFEFMDKLDEAEKMYLIDTLRDQQQLFIDAIQSQLLKGRDFDTVFANVQLLLQGHASADPELNKVLTEVDPKFKGILYRESFLQTLRRLEIPFLSDRLHTETDILQHTLATQATESASKIAKTFAGWTQCQLNANCTAPHARFQFARRNSTYNPQVNALADAVLQIDGMGRSYDMSPLLRDLESVAAKVNSLATEDLTSFFEIATLNRISLEYNTSEALRTFLGSQDLKSQLITAIENKIIMRKNYGVINSYTHEALLNPPDRLRVLTSNLENWVSCYILSQNYSTLRAACLTLWNSTYDLLLVTAANAKVVHHEPLRMGPTQALHSPAASHNFNYLGVSQVVLIVGGMVCTGGLLYHRFFKKPKADKGRPAEKKQRPRPRAIAI